MPTRPILYFKQIRCYAENLIMRTVDLIQRKRDGEELSPEEIAFLVNGYTRGEIPDYQMSAFLMAVLLGDDGPRGQRLTDAWCAPARRRSVRHSRRQSGQALHRRRGRQDQLHRGAAGRAAGVVVPMMSGRALGHTGGTLDKLESIPGFRTNLPSTNSASSWRNTGLAFIGQTGTLAPADRKLYALRDVTATVESIPLIASSIMSKKLAEGIDALVLDVKVGTGAFMKKQVDARRLAQMMVGIGRRMDKQVQALITDMNQPLGYAIGNALEVMEVSQTLQNAGPAGPDRALARTGRAHDLPRQEDRHAGRSARAGREAPGGRLRLPEVQAGDRRRRAAIRRRWTSSNCCPTPPACARSPRRAPATSAPSTPRTSAWPPT